MAKQEVDLNDPATWPDDVTELEKMASGEDTEVEAKADAEGTEVEAKADTEAPKVKAKAEAKEPAPPEAEASADETPDTAADDGADEDAPILTKDGKRTIPFQVLQSERQQRQEAQRQRDELQGQIDALQQEISGLKTRQPEAPPPAVQDELPADVQAKAEKLREDWGDEIADQFLEQTRLTNELKATREELNRLKDGVSSREAQAQASEEKQVQDAIDNSPQMLEWQTSEDATWWQRAISVNKTLLDSDPDYAALSWEDRFSALPDRVQALYGQAPAQKAAPAVPTDSARKAKADAAVAKATAKSVPTSMGDLPSGEPADTKSEIERLEDMSPAEVQAMMNRLASDPDKMAAYLANVM